MKISAYFNLKKETNSEENTVHCEARYPKLFTAYFGRSNTANLYLGPTLVCPEITIVKMTKSVGCVCHYRAAK